MMVGRGCREAIQHGSRPSQSLGHSGWRQPQASASNRAKTKQPRAGRRRVTVLHELERTRDTRLSSANLGSLLSFGQQAAPRPRGEPFQMAGRIIRSSAPGLDSPGRGLDFARAAARARAAAALGHGPSLWLFGFHLKMKMKPEEARGPGTERARTESQGRWQRSRGAVCTDPGQPSLGTTGPSCKCDPLQATACCNEIQRLKDGAFMFGLIQTCWKAGKRLCWSNASCCY